MLRGNIYDQEPCYVISVAARMVGVHAQTLRYYERVGLIIPSRSGGRQRLYSPRDLDRLRRIRALTDEMGVNLAGVEVVLKLMQRISQLEHEIERLTEKLSFSKASHPGQRGATQTKEAD